MRLSLLFIYLKLSADFHRAFCYTIQCCRRIRRIFLSARQIRSRECSVFRKNSAIYCLRSKNRNKCKCRSTRAAYHRIRARLGVPAFLQLRQCTSQCNAVCQSKRSSPTLINRKRIRKSSFHQSVQ